MVTVAGEAGAGHAGLQRGLRSRHVVMIAIGGIIGAGLFVGSSTAIATVGPAVVLSYGIAGLIILMIMRMVSEMAVLNPQAGSFTELIRLGLGNGAGFVCGWLYWYFWAIVVAIEAIAGAVILKAWLPLQVWEIGCGLLALLTLINLFSVRGYGEFEFWLSSTKVAVIIAFIAVAGLWAFGVTAPNGPTFGNLTQFGGFAPHGWAAVLGGVTSVIFALCGAEIATIAAAESDAGPEMVAQMTRSVAVRILLFYVLSIFLIVCVQPWTTIVPGHSPFATALATMGIPGASTIMTLVVLVAVFSCMNSGLYVCSRVLLGLAARGDAPQALVRVNRRGVPVRVILAGSLFAYAGLFASEFSPEVVFSFLVNASGALMLLIYLFVCLAQIRLRRRAEQQGAGPIPVRMWFFPWLTYATLAGILGVLCAMAFMPGLVSQLWASAVAVAVSVGAYLALRRGRGMPARG